MADANRTRPVGIKAPHGARTLEIGWADGRNFAYSHKILRGYCPCAGCQGHSGNLVFQSSGALELRGIEQVGNYAVQFDWADGHNAGIYSFRYLRVLGELLEEHGAEELEAMGELPRV